MINALMGTIQREKTEIGVFITLEGAVEQDEARGDHRRRDTSPVDGLGHSRSQILTIRDLLQEGKKPRLPLLILSPISRPSASPTRMRPSNVNCSGPDKRAVMLVSHSPTQDKRDQ